MCIRNTCMLYIHGINVCFLLLFVLSFFVNYDVSISKRYMEVNCIGHRVCVEYGYPQKELKQQAS